MYNPTILKKTNISRSNFLLLILWLSIKIAWTQHHMDKDVLLSIVNIWQITVERMPSLHPQRNKKLCTIIMFSATVIILVYFMQDKCPSNGVKLVFTLVLPFQIFGNCSIIVLTSLCYVCWFYNFFYRFVIDERICPVSY